MRNLIFLLLIILPFINSCDKEASIGEKDYPYVITKEISDITDSSVVFNGEIVSTGKDEIIEYGFLWDTDEPKVDTANKVVINNPANKGSYSIMVDYNLYKDSEQLVRAYIKTVDKIVYGNQIRFTSNGGVAVELYEINPTKGYAGSKVVIKGNNFSDQKEHVKVYFGDIEAEIDSCSDNRIVVKVPDIEADIEANITITVYNKQVKSDEKFRAFTYWKKMANFPGDARYGAAAFSLNNVGYVGFGKQYYGAAYNDLYALDPGSNSWSKKANFPGTPRAFAVSCVIDNKAYLGFGYDGETYYNDLWSYEPESDKWTKLLEDERIRTFSDAFFVLNNELYIFTQAGSFKYSPANNSLTHIDMFPGKYRFFTSGVTCDGLGYIIAGQEPGNNLLKDLWCYNPITEKWTKKADIPAAARDGIACVVINNKIYAGLGGIWGGDYLDFYEYTPSSNKWIRIQNFQGDKRELPVSFTLGNKGYIGTGRSNRIDMLNDFWEFDPNKE